jgi:hypothetical protein
MDKAEPSEESRRTRGSNAVVAVVDFYSTELRSAEKQIANQQAAIQLMAEQLRDMEGKLRKLGNARGKRLPRGTARLVRAARVWEAMVAARQPGAPDALNPESSELFDAVRQLGPEPKK